MRKNEISNFKKQEDKVIYDAWERFKLLLKSCVGQKFLEMDIMHEFTTGLNSYTYMLLDVSAGGTMKIKKSNEVKELINNMSLNEYCIHTEEEAASKKKCMIDLNTHDDLFANNKLFNIQLETIAKRMDARVMSH